ncbi:mucin-5AC-like [Anneissia japonica]|uniref:mucin-5AC-like n=1 Tax=Anneissia japonica TaxID=1529436 RepID=UPI00142578B1|nr:mucin-5AC-like [Anneissia japonica]
MVASRQGASRHLIKLFLLLALRTSSSAFILNWFTGKDHDNYQAGDESAEVEIRSNGEECGPNMEYSECGGSCQATCENPNAVCTSVGVCLAGCSCKDGLVRQGDQCIPLSECRCEYDGKFMDNGDIIKLDCNECTCNSGTWQCTENQCGATCWTAGLGFFKTFDSKFYYHEGNCEHYLVKDCRNEGLPYEIRLSTENCYAEATGEDNQCRKAIKILHKGTEVRIGYASEVIADGEELANFPWSESGIFIERPALHVIKITLDIGFEILFDEKARVQIFASNDLVGATCGLCGTFNNNIADEFLIPSGAVETNKDSFWNNWLVDSTCIPSYTPIVPSCIVYEEMQPVANELCANILNPLGPFAACHAKIDPNPYYATCQSDVCSCTDASSCHCSIYSQYAADCSAKLVKVSWRLITKGCHVKCPSGTEYNECHNSCNSSCRSQVSDVQCHDTCVAGCSCPPGQVFDANGNCIPADRCHCEAFGRIFDATDVLSLDCSTCTCDKGSWSCEPAGCTCGENAEYSNCMMPRQCQKTCANIGSDAVCPDTACFPGCQCSPGYVLDEGSGRCVLPVDCSCYHGGVAYPSESEANLGCKSCFCSGGKWTCNDTECQGSCMAWGDSHFKSFDGRMFDFTGDCQYDFISVDDFDKKIKFNIGIRNQVCSSSGLTCLKAIIIKQYDQVTDVWNTLRLVQGAPVIAPSHNGFNVKQRGKYVIVDSCLGYSVLWNRGTWLQVKAQPFLRNKVRGLCGNFDGDQSNDFQTRDGLDVISSLEFGNSWKVHRTCPDTSPIEVDSCASSSHMKLWAQKKCSVITGLTFQVCHGHVSPEPFYEKCVSDTCACDFGGECECTCTAIAAYAQECNDNGVHISWRSDKLCPMQCNGGESCLMYSPCVDICGGMCIEGCCPKNSLLYNGVCIEPDMECPSCNGYPVAQYYGIQYSYHYYELYWTVIGGYKVSWSYMGNAYCWTQWFDDENGSNISPSVAFENESIDDIFLQYPTMSCQKPTGIQCQTIDGLAYDKTSQTVKCDINFGLSCSNSEGQTCFNYRIRLICPELCSQHIIADSDVIVGPAEVDAGTTTGAAGSETGSTSSTEGSKMESGNTSRTTAGTDGTGASKTGEGSSSGTTTGSNGEGTKSTDSTGSSQTTGGASGTKTETDGTDSGTSSTGGSQTDEGSSSGTTTGTHETDSGSTDTTGETQTSGGTSGTATGTNGANSGSTVSTGETHTTGDASGTTTGTHETDSGSTGETQTSGGTSETATGTDGTDAGTKDSTADSPTTGGTSGTTTTTEGTDSGSTGGSQSSGTTGGSTTTVTEYCWTQWFDDENGGDISASVVYENESIEEIFARYPTISCQKPTGIQCQTIDGIAYDKTSQVVQCDTSFGLRCSNNEGQTCFNYKIRLICAELCSQHVITDSGTMVGPGEVDAGTMTGTEGSESGPTGSTEETKVGGDTSGTTSGTDSTGSGTSHSTAGSETSEGGSTRTTTGTHETDSGSTDTTGETQTSGGASGTATGTDGTDSGSTVSTGETHTTGDASGTTTGTHETDSGSTGTTGETQTSGGASGTATGTDGTDSGSTVFTGETHTTGDASGKTSGTHETDSGSTDTTGETQTSGGTSGTTTTVTVSCSSICSFIKTSLFNVCRDVIDIDKYYAMCSEGDACNPGFACSVISAMVAEYEQKSFTCLSWRKAVGCDTTCPSGFEFMECTCFNSGCSLGVRDECEPWQKRSGCGCTEGFQFKNGACLLCDPYEAEMQTTVLPSLSWKSGNCRYRRVEKVHQLELENGSVCEATFPIDECSGKCASRSATSILVQDMFVSRSETCGCCRPYQPTRSSMQVQCDSGGAVMEISVETFDSCLCEQNRECIFED